MKNRIEWRVKLLLTEQSYYRVKRGQRLAEIARAFSCPPRVLAFVNGLTEEVREGQVLFIPRERRNLYVVRGGESKTLLCGSPEAFENRNRTKYLYPSQEIWL